MTRTKTALDFDAFCRAVDQFAAMGGKSIDFNVTIGDPLLDKRILERARYVKRYPQFTSLGFVTTLQWLHRHDVKEFVSLFDWVSVSIVLTGREQYRKFFGVDKYYQALENLDVLIEAIKSHRPDFSLHLGIKPTDQPIAEVIEHPDFRRVNALVDQDLVNTVKTRSFFVDDWNGLVELPGYLRKRPRIPRYRRPCRFLYQTLHVHSNGKVAGCACRDANADSEVVVGDIASETLSEIWRRPRLQQIRDAWRTQNRVPDIYQDCRFYQF